MPASENATGESTGLLLDPEVLNGQQYFEQRLAFADGGPLRIDPSEPKTLTEALLQTVARSKNHGITFVLADGRKISQPYPELLEKARRVLTGLRASGMRPGDRVILQSGSMELHFIAFWACVLGGIIPVTVAIPPAYDPQNGIVLKLFNVWKLLERPAILTTQSLIAPICGLEKSLGMDGLKTLAVDELIKNEPAQKIHPAKPDDILFYQLTSGSTGVPKCIQERHRSVIAHIHGSAQFNGYSPDDVTLNWLPFDHVVPILTFHLKDVYLGCKQIHAQPDLVLANPVAWLDLIEKIRVTHTWSPNFGFKLVSGALQNTNGKSWDLSSVKFFMNAGEQVTTPVVSEFLRATEPFGVRETAMQPAFGMAEVCTCMTYTNDFSVENTPSRFLKSSLNDILVEADADESGTIDFIDLGPPMPGVAIRITDSENKIVSEGKVGRFQIKGDVVTPGYLNNDAANKEAFVGDGWFNSGDIGFILEGRLFLAGREKEIINIRGAKFYCYEIEDIVSGMSEVEPTFVASAGVADAKSGTEELALFFVPRNGTDPGKLAKTIRGKVAAGFGITPAYVVQLTAKTFLKTTSGKIQRTQMRKNLEAGQYADLLRPTITSSDKARPVSDLEKSVAQIWKNILGAPEVPTNESFFELGGDSLRAIQIVSRIRDHFNVQLSLPALFSDAATVGGMCKLIEKLRTQPGAEASPELKPVPRNQPLALSFPQQQIWILEQLQPGTSLYNVARALELAGALDTAALERSVSEMLTRHEVLRTNIIAEGMPAQKIRAKAELKIAVMDLRKFPEAERRRAAFALASLDAKRPFDLANDLLVRTRLMRTGETTHVLALTFHQTVIDGWSVDVFIRQLADIYKSITAREKNPLPLMRIQYADFAQWQRESLKPEIIQPHMDYWRQQLAGHTPTELTLDFPRTESIEAVTEKWEMPADMVAKVRSFARAEGLTLFGTLLAAFKKSLCQKTNSGDVTVGSAMGMRHATELENLVGFIVNPVALRTKVSVTDPFREVAHRVRETIVQASSHAAAPFEMVAQSVQSGSGADQKQLFKIYFGAIDSLGEFQFGDVGAKSNFISPGTAQFDLTVFVAEQRDKVVCLFEYKPALFKAETIRELIGDFEKLLGAAMNNPNFTPAQR